MESPTQSHYPESPTMEDDIVYPCKGCGEILEEGKAFELAGNRWHIDCFRCNTCGTLLDSDANLLLLGDGSLICNDCTYSCNSCGNKIEDLAILTGDQAFCANCFRCRNCKRKIENLRYARTSQGIFCMSCHESLMARRRKKTKKPPSSVPKVDKSLPALPPTAPPASAQFTPDLETPSDIFSEPTTTDVSPRPPHPSNFRRDASPASFDERRSENLPSNIYKETNHSEADNTSDDNGILLPFALDPNTAPGPSPNSGKSHGRPGDSKSQRDYFNRTGTGGHREMLKENRSRSASSERQPSKSPHIAYQEKGRQHSDQVADAAQKRKEVANEPTASSTDRTRNQHASSAAPQPSEGFKLQEVPKNKRAEARKNSLARSPSFSSGATDMGGRLKSHQAENSVTSPAHVETSPTTSGSSYSSTQRVERPARGDSLNSAHRSQASTTRKEANPLLPPSPTTPTRSQQERKTPATGGARSQQNGNYNISSPAESILSRSISDPPIPPQRSAGRPPPPAADTFVSPRAPPQPPSSLQNSKAPESASTTLQDTMSPGALPRYNAQGDFSQDEDFARLLMNQDGQDREGGGVLRRVSNAMSKHSRSFSDRSSINQRGHKKWPTNGSIDISSPTMPSPDSKEEHVNLRNELRRAQQKVAELEAEKNGLQESVHNAADLKQANTILREKRNTMAVLDTQREMVIRELEIMTEHLKRAKENHNSVDYNQMKSDVIKDFANALQKLKDQMGGQIEDLISKRTALTDEISNLIQMKDKGFQEYESLSAQNKKLSDMNQNLIESIQGMLQKNKQANGGQSIDASRSPANGLGIYQQNQKAGKSELSFDSPQIITHEPSYSNLHDPDNDAVLVQPQLVSVRKGKPTKFSNWKKGGQAMKSVTKGFKGAFAASEPRQEDYNTVKVIGTPYGSTHTQPDLVSLASTNMTASSTKSKEDPGGRNWFTGSTGKPAGKLQDPRFKPMHGNSSNNNVDGEQPPNVLFGSDLTARCEYEKRMIPAIVSRCIQEVETRGMDVEGIYRKSGGNSQVNQVKNGFSEDDEYDLSDPDLDIHAVTSALKAYLRRMPGPLIPYEIYDDFVAAGAAETNAAKAKGLHAALSNIPKAHYDCLQFLVFHLSRVIQHSKDNLMTPLNIAVVFAPTIMRPADVQRELTDMNIQRDAVQALLENHKNIFFDEE